MEKGKAYVIDFGVRTLEEVRKCVMFYKGVGVLDHAGVCAHRPDIYTGGVSEDGKYPRPSGQYATFELLALAEYFAGHGCTVTEISEAEAARIRQGLKKGKLPDDKYLAEPAPAVKSTKAESGDAPKSTGSKDAPIDASDLEKPGKKGKGGKK